MLFVVVVVAVVVVVVVVFVVVAVVAVVVVVVVVVISSGLPEIAVQHDFPEIDEMFRGFRRLPKCSEDCMRSGYNCMMAWQHLNDINCSQWHSLGINCHR